MAYGIAIFVYHRIMRGLVAFIGLRFAGLDIFGSTCLACVNAFGQLRGIVS